ncbi:MAG: fumarylacetoacetate hydrolase family protein [Cryomorphaceae bacterium]|nr:fumarylacetoacetate hydrolase family protein [Cryomorphaceae bacterium]
MKIICIGRNYAKHAAELKNEIPDEPVIFMKPDTALLSKGNDFYLPKFSEEIHYEAELVVRINRVGKNIQEKFAHKYYSQVAVGLDFTARDLQQKLKEKGLPWEKAKGFDGAAAVGNWVDLNTLPNDINNLRFSLHIDGIERQNGCTADMLFPVDKMIAYVSSFFTLKVGDVLFTGTPEGVGKLERGQRLTALLEGSENLNMVVN